jgi:hypothetical protein
MALEPYRSPAESPPEEPAAEVVDEATRLGLLRSVHRPPPLWRPLAAGAIAFVPALIIVGTTSPASAAVGPVLAAFAVVIFAIIAWGPLRRRGVRVELHAHGVVVVTPRSRDVVVFEDVDSLWYDLNVSSLSGRTIARITEARLVDHEGVEHRVPLRLVDSAGVFQWMVKHCSDPLFPDAQAALRAGETLTFGDVRIDREGIAFGKAARAAWNEIRLARMQPGSIALFKRNPLLPWRTIDLVRVPHPTLFARLFRELASNVEIDDPLSTPPT